VHVILTFQCNILHHNFLKLPSPHITNCVDSISNWMHSHRLQLNDDKTELMWSSSTRKLLQLPSCSFSVAGSLVCPINAIRDLGIFIDNDLGVATHIRRTMPCNFAALCQLRQYITNDCFHSWWCRLYTQDLTITMATSFWSGFQHIYSGVSSQLSQSWKTVSQ